MRHIIPALARHILAAVLLIPYTLFAGSTGKIAGTVTDAKTGEALIGVNVIISGVWVNGNEVPTETFLGAATDVNGEYFILNIQPGTYSVKASYVGFQTEVQTQVKVAIDKTTWVDFQLNEATFETDEVVVTAFSAQGIEMDQTSSKQAYTVPELESIAGVNNIQDIINLQADVVDNHFRGGRTGESLYLINGSSIVNPISNSSSFQPLTTALQEVEVYTSGFSAEYGNAQSGVVNIVTREGGEVWQSSMEFSSSLPGYDIWGGSFYDKDNMPFFDLLSQPAEWLTNNNPNNPGTNLGPFEDYLNFLSGGEDSLYIATMARDNWLQVVREIGWEYKNQLEYRFDYSVGGPITEGVRIFTAGRLQQKYGYVPTPDPNRDMQLMANLSWQVNQSNKLKLLYSHYNRFANVLNAGSFLEWSFDRQLSVPKRTEEVHQASLTWNKVFSPATFGDLSFDVLSTVEKETPEFLQTGTYRKETDSLAAYDVNYANWYINNPSGHRIADLPTRFKHEESMSYNLKGSITSQVTKNNLIKAGFQFTTYELKVDNRFSLNTVAESSVEDYTVYPYEGGLYVQDKMEFEGMIANIGLRYDFYNFNTSYFADIFSPLRNPNFDPDDPETGPEQNAELAARDDSEFFGQLQPRVGISFPITEESVVYLNYGVFVQRPAMSRILSSEVTGNGQVISLGNPRLKPERTIAYDVGLVQGLPLGFKLEVSAYYKDVQDLIQQAIYFDKNFVPYYTFSNLDYANIKGFHVNLEKMAGNLSFLMRYNFQEASGKAATPFDNPISYYETETATGETADLPDPKDVALDFNREHRLVANVRYTTPENFGPELLGNHWFGRMSLSFTLKSMTGRPYTWDPNGEGLLFNDRTRGETDLSMRLQKKIDFGASSITIYLEGFNLLNQKQYAYRNYVNDIDLELLKMHGEEFLEVMSVEEDSPYLTSRTVRVISNNPRTFRLGAVIKF